MNYRSTVSRFGSGNPDDPRRDLRIECGHPETEDITLEDYHDKYDRSTIAKKVVDLYPNHCWQVQPNLIEDEDPDTETLFEKTVRNLGKKLQGEDEEEYYAGDDGDAFWEYCYRADKAAGIGHYGCVLLGVGGGEGEDLSTPLTKMEFTSGSPKRELIYMRVFPEMLAPVVEWNHDSSSRRYNKPEFYDLQFDDERMARVSSDSSTRTVQGTQRAHWTRVVHITDELLSNEVFHIPRMRNSYNRILDTEKLYGSSAEMYYLGAFPGFHFGTHPQLGGDVDIDVNTMRSQVEEWLAGLQRAVFSSGMTLESLAPQVVDPTPQINTQIEAICIEQDCPKRIFMGSERGELASTQDKSHWYDVIKASRKNKRTPRVIVPITNRLIWLGILPRPLQGYRVEWPEVETLSPLDKANVALLITQAIVAFIEGYGEQVIPLPTFLTLILGMTDKEAKAIVDALEETEDELTPLEKVEERNAQRAVDLQAEQGGPEEGSGGDGQAPPKKAGVERDDKG